MSRTHGESGTRLYSIWKGINKRCYGVNCRAYPQYGGRGITVCPEWRTDYLAFRDWAQANGYRDDLSIDRINPDGPYAPFNTRWADATTQANNLRTNVRLSAFGECKTVAQWSLDERCVVSRSTLAQRIHANTRPPEAMLTTPVLRREPDDPTIDRLYCIWSGIKQRCYNPTSSVWEWYGAKGIRMCDEWRHRSAPFKAWAVANGYADDLSLDRLDPSGNYEPGNVHWISQGDQLNNTSRNVELLVFGEAMTISQWSRDPRCVVSTSTLRDRVQIYGWEHERALTTPSRRRK